MFNSVTPQTLPVVGRLFPRRFHLFCIGTAKSGTHSVASIFQSNFRSRHEPYSEKAIHSILKYENGSITQSDLARFVITREKLLHLEVNSSQLNFFFLDILIKHFPQAKFIFTIREPYSWLSSYINHQLGRKQVSNNWQAFRDLRFKNNLYTFSLEEEVLKENNLYPIDSYLSYWAEHNRKVINTVPTERLLILQTNQISNQLDKIAHFVNIHPNLLQKRAAHSYKAVKKFNILDKIDSQFLAEKISHHSQHLEKYFV
jgi:hypothetical protein